MESNNETTKIQQNRNRLKDTEYKTGVGEGKIGEGQELRITNY